MKLKTLLGLGTIIVAILIVTSMGASSLEKELSWYQREGCNTYSLTYRDFQDTLPLNYTLNDNLVSKKVLRDLVRDNEGNVYYCSFFRILYCFRLADGGSVVFFYYCPFRARGNSFITMRESACARA